MRIVLSRALVCSLLLAATFAQAAPLLSYHVVAQHPHDTTAFTEGLAISHGQLFESTGRNGSSRISVRDLASLRLLHSVSLDDHDFGEGLTVIGSNIAQLTWKSGVGYLYDLSLRRIGSFRISSDGWGLAYNGKTLIRSDGSSTLQLLNTRTFGEVGRLAVRDGQQPIDQLNELEYAEGRLYANIWLTDRIAVIEPRTGWVTGWLDLSALKQQFVKPSTWEEADDVLNGIAYDSDSKHFFVTGKCWPVMFEIVITGATK